MKKVLYLVLMATLMMACKKDDPTPPKTTYQIINNTETSESSIEFLDGSLFEVVIFCYVGNDVARQDNLPAVSSGGGKSELIEVPDSFDKLKVSFKLLPKESPYYNLPANGRKYVVSFSFLQKGKSNQIIIDGLTMVSGELKNGHVETISVNKALKSI